MRHRRTLTSHAAALLAAAIVLAGPALAADDLEARAARLAELRTEVSALQDRIAERKDGLDTELRALDAQRVDLDVQARREELRLAQLQGELDAMLARTASDAGLEEAVRPGFDRGVEELRRSVRAGLPFRVDERLAALDALAAQVEGGDLLPSRAIGRLWAFAEDELRLTRENVLDRQVVALPQGDVLADVARLGMTALFFRAPDGTRGHAARGADGWTWVVVEDAEVARRIDVLFDTLGKGIRTGWFEVPWAFGEVPR